LKHKVQSLLDSGWLTFQEKRPSVEKHPLTSHVSTASSTKKDQVAAIKQEDVRPNPYFVHLYLPNQQLNNWDFVDILMIFTKQEEM